MPDISNITLKIFNSIILSKEWGENPGVVCLSSPRDKENHPLFFPNFFYLEDWLIKHKESICLSANAVSIVQHKRSYLFPNVESAGIWWGEGLSLLLIKYAFLFVLLPRLCQTFLIICYQVQHQTPKRVAGTISVPNISLFQRICENN